ncbi:serine/threonine-protein kinase [Metallococcus carri]|uniref:serine/threonine-protein kinase n=1 Tax=Metallococcus carri TaxID=1656884 RepID=UPI001A9EE816|nr:serine/threonine-protein kinase [Metallococcus carri]
MSDRQDRAGTRFGPYELRSLIGRGGMGEVYQAYDTTKERTVALKLLPVDLARDPAYRARFRREALTAARLQEPHVIPIHDFGERDGVLYIDMRLVRGRNLRQLLDRGQAMVPGTALELARQVAAALDAAHADGLVHRDVKPENVLVTADGFAYLADFGIAARADDTRLTQDGSAVGSIAYMAPERFSDRPVGPASDVYSLACVLFELLTGSSPFKRATSPAQIAAHLYDDPPRASELRPELPRAIDTVLHRALAKDPGQRYATARAFVEDADLALRDARVPDLSGPTVSRPFRPGGAIADEAALTQGAPVRRVPAAEPEPPIERVQPAPLAESRRRGRGLGLLAALVALAMVVAGGVAAYQRWGPGSATAAGPSRLAGLPTTTSSTAPPTTTPGPSSTSTTTAPPPPATVPPGDGYDVYGWRTAAYARCHTPDLAQLVMRTASAQVSICTGATGVQYYRSSVSDGTHIEIPGAYRTADGWAVTNNGYLYLLTKDSLAINRGGSQVFNETTTVWATAEPQ